MSARRRSWTLVRIFGIPIRVSPSWLLLFGLIVFSLSSKDGWFHQWGGIGPLSEGAFWALGVVGALGLFASLLAHELCHSVVARYTGMPVSGITLFVFGGVSELGDEPPTAVAEFFMAVVGPLSSVIISVACLGMVVAGKKVFHWPETVNALFGYLALINFVLAVFNSIPAFPLDGGRILRSVMWGATGDLRGATQVAARIGSGLAIAMIAGGALILLAGGLIGGMWLIFIGFFLRQAAAGSLQHVIVRQGLAGETVGSVMGPPPVTVTPDVTLGRFVREYALPYRRPVFPVVDESGRLVGAVRSRDPARVDRLAWGDSTVADVVRGVTEDQVIGPHAQALEALSRLQGEEERLLMVVEDGRLVGVLGLRDLLDFLSLKIELSRRTGRR